MKKLVLLTFTAAGLFFTSEMFSQTSIKNNTSDNNSSIETTRTGKSQLEVIDTQLQDLDRTEKELKSTGITGEALENRMKIITQKRNSLLLRKESLSNENKPQKS